MPARLLTRREAAQLSGTNETTVKKAVDARVISTHRRGTQSWIELEDVAVLTMLGHLNGLGLQVSHKRRVRDWIRTDQSPRELELTPAVVVRKPDDVDDAHDRAEHYVRLREQWIVRDPEIKGGEPVIKGSRVSVHTLAARIAAGEDERALQEDFPHIPAEAREVAVQYARANPRRGRPAGRA